MKNNIHDVQHAIKIYWTYKEEENVTQTQEKRPGRRQLWDDSVVGISKAYKAASVIMLFEVKEKNKHWKWMEI